MVDIDGRICINAQGFASAKENLLLRLLRMKRIAGKVCSREPQPTNAIANLLKIFMSSARNHQEPSVGG